MCVSGTQEYNSKKSSARLHNILQNEQSPAQHHRYVSSFLYSVHVFGWCFCLRHVVSCMYVCVCKMCKLECILYQARPSFLWQGNNWLLFYLNLIRYEKHELYIDFNDDLEFSCCSLLRYFSFISVWGSCCGSYCLGMLIDRKYIACNLSKYKFSVATGIQSEHANVEYGRLFM